MGLKTFVLKTAQAKARIWPSLAQMCHIRLLEEPYAAMATAEKKVPPLNPQPYSCRANAARIRQSAPDCGPGLLVESP